MNTKRKGRKPGFKLPANAPPAFALPGHEWRLAGDIQKSGEYIHSVGEWILWRKQPLPAERTTAPLPTALEPFFETEKCRLMNPEGYPSEWVAKYKVSPLFQKVAELSDVLSSLPRFIEASIHRAVEIAPIRCTMSEKALADTDTTIKEETTKAAELLFYLTKKSCEELTRLAKQYPQIFRRIAEKEMAWPLMMSRHPGFGERHTEILNNLQLGKTALVEMNAGARLNTQKLSREKAFKATAPPRP